MEESDLIEMADFLKMAFCIDGQCKYRSMDILISQKTGEANNEVMTFDLMDSQRGKFQVSISTQEKA